MLQRVLIVLFFGWMALPSTGQELRESGFDRFTMSDGLSHNNINGIVQDSTGYIWAATVSGLNRYNGSRFVQYHSSSNERSLPAEELTGINWLNKQEFALKSAGLHIMNTRTGVASNLFIPYEDKKYQYKFNVIERVTGDEDGNIYVLSRSGFYHFDKNKKLLFRFDYYQGDDIRTKHFFFGRDLFVMDEQRLLIVSIVGLYIYDKVKKTMVALKPGDIPLLDQFLNYTEFFYTPYQFFQPKPGTFIVLNLENDSLMYINLRQNKKTVTIQQPFDSLRIEFRFRSKLLVLNDSTFYVTGHFSGFYKLTLNTRTGEAHILPEKYFDSYVCNGLLKDRDNNLWIATTKGLLRQNSERALVQLAHLPTALLDSFPTTRLDDIWVTNTAIYAGQRGDGGLLIFNKKKFAFEKQIYFTRFGRRGNSIYALVGADSANLLLATDWHLLLFNEKTRKEKVASPSYWGDGDWASDLSKDSKGNIWVSAFRTQRYNPFTNTYKEFPTHPQLLTVPVSSDEDHQGNVWMTGHGLARYNTKLDSFDYFIDSFPSLKMLDRQINSMVIDQDNNIWFNSNNNGLTHYDLRTKKFRQFTQADGMPDDNIASMLIVGNTLWMATYSGIACMDLRTSRIISFGKEDGFPEMQVLKGARLFFDAPSQQLYIGFSTAIARFNPNYMLRRRQPSHVFIENISVNGKKDYVLPGENIKLNWQDNEIMITIGSINYSDSYTERYAYRIYKDDKTPWQQLGSQPAFSISSLSPGTHRIQVKVFSLNNRWPEQTREVSVVVLPPFWMEIWFITAVVALLMMSIYLYVKWRTGIARKKEMEKTQIEKIKAHNYKNQFELEQISNYFSSSLKGKQTEDEVLWDVTGNLISKLDYVDCMIYLWNHDKTKMIQKAAYGPKGKPEFISANPFEVEPGQGIVGHVIESQQPVLVEDTRKDPRYRVDEEFRLSEICVPIMHNGELMGIIDSEHYEAAHFKERDIKILTTIATLIANKLKQLESEKSLEDTNKQLTTINEKLAEAQLSALQAQMNPHFVFNALNSIKRMILDGNNEKASRYLSKFALMIRMTLNHSKDIFVTLHENIEYLKTYLEMEQLRFDESFSYRITTDSEIDKLETLIPSLMIQPLVENAIWHGLLPTDRDKKINITFMQVDNKITCVIEDNGIGIRQSEKMKSATRPLHQSVGLENLQKRIKIMNEKYDTGCSLKIEDLKESGINGHGTRVILRFNVITIN